MFVKKQIIASASEETRPYLIRWAINTPFGGVKLHHILRSDEDRDCHDHPWSFLSIILAGGYWEHRPDRKVYAIDREMRGRRCFRCGETVEHNVGCERGRRTVKTWYGPGSILWRPRPSVHRLELPMKLEWSYAVEEVEGIPHARAVQYHEVPRPAWSLVFTGPKRSEWGFHTICGWVKNTAYSKAKAEGC